MARSDLRAVPVLKLDGVWMEDSVGACPSPLTSGAKTAYPNRQSCGAQQLQPRPELAVLISWPIPERSCLPQLTSVFPLFPLLGLPQLPRVSRRLLHLTCQHQFSVRDFANEAAMLQPQSSQISCGHRDPFLVFWVKSGNCQDAADRACSIRRHVLLACEKIAHDSCMLRV